MVQRTRVFLVDDIDGNSDPEAKVATVDFALDGNKYEIDLSAFNAEALRDLLDPFVVNARKVKSGESSAVRRSGRTRQRTVTSTARSDSAAIRDWAIRSGIPINSRGRIPAEITEAYDALPE